jgi:hypothetical protein
MSLWSTVLRKIKLYMRECTLEFAIVLIRAFLYRFGAAA